MLDSADVTDVHGSLLALRELADAYRILEGGKLDNRRHEVNLCNENYHWFLRVNGSTRYSRTLPKYHKMWSRLLEMSSSPQLHVSWLPVASQRLRFSKIRIHLSLIGGSSSMLAWDIEVLRFRKQLLKPWLPWARLSTAPLLLKDKALLLYGLRAIELIVTLWEYIDPRV